MASQITRGRLKVTQRMVMLDAVCAQAPGAEDDEEEAAIEFETARLVSDLDVGEEVRSGEPGAGDAVELRELLRGEPFVGDASGGGNSLGCWRVDTMAATWSSG